LSVAGLAENMLDVAIAATTDEERQTERQERAQGTRSEKMREYGAAAQSAAATWSIIDTVASAMFGLPPVSSASLAGIGKYMQKRGEGYTFVESVGYGSTKLLGGLLGPLGQVGEVIEQTTEVQEWAAAVGTTTALVDLQAEKDALLADQETILNWKQETLFPLEQQYISLQVKPPAALQELIESTDERIRKIEERDAWYQDKQKLLEG